MGLKDMPHVQQENEKHLAESLRLLTLSQELFSLKPPWGDPGVSSHLSKLALDLADTAAGVSSRLILGVLGGTGVGKSTLISALAGEVISKVGPIRPLTSQPLIYRHQDFPSPPNFKGEEVVHQVDGLRSIAIIDFPDFDSLRTEHHQTIKDFIPQLDLVIWLTDYHKYADLRFYEIMQQVSEKVGSKAQVALLNKMDELADKPQGQGVVGEVLESFSQLLDGTQTWSGPKPWPVSAAQALIAPLNPTAGGFAPLRKLLDDLGQEKMRLAMKMDNLAARNYNFKKNISAAVNMKEWSQQADKLNTFLKGFQPGEAIKGDINFLRIRRNDFLEPKLVTIRQEVNGPLALFTDLWDFLFSRFKSQRDFQNLPRPILNLNPNITPDLGSEALGLAYYLAACHADLIFIGYPSNYQAAQSGLKSEQIIQQAINKHLTNSAQPKPPTGVLLWVWPPVLAFILIWAETGGSFGGPVSLAAASIKAIVPWLIFGFLGDIIWSRFIWFRIRRQLEYNYNQALAEAEKNLLELAKGEIGAPVLQARDNLQKIFQSLAKIFSLKK